MSSEEKINIPVETLNGYTIPKLEELDLSTLDVDTLSAFQHIVFRKRQAFVRATDLMKSLERKGTKQALKSYLQGATQTAGVGGSYRKGEDVFVNPKGDRGILEIYEAIVKKVNSGTPVDEAFGMLSHSRVSSEHFNEKNYPDDATLPYGIKRSRSKKAVFSAKRNINL